MKWVVFIVLGLLVFVGAAAAFFPMSMAAQFVADHEPSFRYGKASGSVWDGKLTAVQFGDQSIGDISLKADPAKLMSGVAAGKMGIRRPEYSGEGLLNYRLNGGELRISNLKLAGKVAAVPGLPAEVRRSDGKFTLTVSELELGREACSVSSGEVWTDALAKVDMKGKWTGPELRGPVTCKDGKLIVAANGKAATGEDVAAQMVVGGDLSLDLSARVEGATPGAMEALSEIGFRVDGPTMVLHRALGGRAS